MILLKIYIRYSALYFHNPYFLPQKTSTIQLIDTVCYFIECKLDYDCYTVSWLYAMKFIIQTVNCSIKRMSHLFYFLVQVRTHEKAPVGKFTWIIQSMFHPTSIASWEYCRFSSHKLFNCYLEIKTMNQHSTTSNKWRHDNNSRH